MQSCYIKHTGKDARVVEEARLESVKALHGFESRSFRSLMIVFLVD